MTECEKIQEKLSEMLDGELSEADEAEVRAHIAHCPDCAALYAAFSALSEAAAEPEDVPDALHGAVMDRVCRAEKAVKFQKNFQRWRPIALTAACLVVLVGTVLSVNRGLTLKSAAPTASENKTGMGETYGIVDGSMFSYSCDASDFPAEEWPETSMKSDPDAGLELEDRMEAMYAPIPEPEALYTMTVRITGENEDGSVAEVVGSDYAEPGTVVYLYWTEQPETLAEGEELAVACVWYNAETGECWDAVVEEK